uniref:Putative secreted protein n=1 Tax=Anopheles darlingi TaxID=43151 RepID=A0A2M4D299_ANODA
MMVVAAARFLLVIGGTDLSHGLRSAFSLPWMECSRRNVREESGKKKHVRKRVEAHTRRVLCSRNVSCCGFSLSKSILSAAPRSGVVAVVEARDT